MLDPYINATTGKKVTDLAEINEIIAAGYDLPDGATPIEDQFDNLVGNNLTWADNQRANRLNSNSLYRWINDEFSWCLIQAVNSLKKEIEKYGIKDTDKLDDLKMVNREKNNSRNKENSMLVHFKNVEDFIEDVKKYPELKKISFITRELKGGEPTRLDYEFFKKWVYIEVDDYQRIFILKDDAVLKKDKKEFLKSLAENIESVKDEFWDKKYSQLDKEELNLLLGLIENVINLDSVISEYK